MLNYFGALKSLITNFSSLKLSFHGPVSTGETTVVVLAEQQKKEHLATLLFLLL
jgi:hypothetical protein